jgi:chromosome segregation ATPase
MSAAELEEKQKQLDDLQRSFNEYVESSKELEAELEAALEEAAEKIDRTAAREVASEQKVRELQAKVDELSRSSNSKPNQRDGKGLDNDELLIKFRRLENENEDLHNQVRILEASVEDLNHKVHSLEEDAIFLKTDVETITMERDQLEEEMNSAVDALEKKLEISENDRRKLSTDIDRMTQKVLDEKGTHDPNDDKVQMLLFKQDKGIDFIKATLDALAVETAESHRHGHHDHSAVWHEKVETLRTQLHVTETERHQLNEEVYTLRKQVEESAQNHYRRDHFEELEDAFHESEKERAQLLEHVRTLDGLLAEARQNEHPAEVVTALQDKLRDKEADAKELGAQVITLQKHLEAVLGEATAAEELRLQNARQQKDIELLSVKLRDLELAKEELEQALEQALKDAGPKFERVGTYHSGWETSSLTRTTNTSSVEINSSSTTQVTVTQVINSGDRDLMKAELLRLVSAVQHCLYCHVSTVVNGVALWQ